MACWVTKCWCVRPGNACTVIHGDTCLGMSGEMMLGRVIRGTAPGVLFRVTRQCNLGVAWWAHLAVRFWDCIIQGALVMHGMVGIGVLLITLCCSLFIICSFTLCSSKILGGFKTFVMLWWRSLMSCCPFRVALAIAVESAHLFVSARKCWCWVRLGNWQCWGNNLVEPDIW